VPGQSSGEMGWRAEEGKARRQTMH